MAKKPRLADLAGLAPDVRLPAYAPAGHGDGIVHIGAGAFFRAHMAVYTDDALAAAHGDWRIAGASLRGTEIADALNPQNGLYTLIERGGGGVNARIIGSVSHIIAATREPRALLAAMIAPSTRIVSLTVTEKAYGIDRHAGAVDTAHPAVSADLASPRAPGGVLGAIVEALRLRREAGIEPFTVLCCDNLPDNGALVRQGVTDFATRTDPALAAWIANDVAFPATMVDRITPAPTTKTQTDAAELTGFSDHGAVETEPFSQWVIEDRFPSGRPQWEAGGALFVRHVAPYEAMKLRMLNGTHSMLAYAGFLAGCKHVRDTMKYPALAALIDRHLSAAAATLRPLEGIDFAAYADALKTRFANPAIAHETYQIAMDGTEKLPQRILLPACDTLAAGQDIRPFAFAVAAWMRYCLGRSEAGAAYALRDPREASIQAALAQADGAEAMSAALHHLPGVFPERLVGDPQWQASIKESLDRILREGINAAIQAEAGGRS